MSKSKTKEVDLFIIGGGINGCGIARDAVGRGLSVTLAEMNDIGGATSSSSLKISSPGPSASSSAIYSVTGFSTVFKAATSGFSIPSYDFASDLTCDWTSSAFFAKLFFNLDPFDICDSLSLTLSWTFFSP